MDHRDFLNIDTHFGIPMVQEYKHYFMLSGRISRNICENIFWSYTSITSKNTDFHVLVA